MAVDRTAIVKVAEALVKDKVFRTHAISLIFPLAPFVAVFCGKTGFRIKFQFLFGRKGDLCHLTARIPILIGDIEAYVLSAEKAIVHINSGNTPVSSRFMHSDFHRIICRAYKCIYRQVCGILARLDHSIDGRILVINHNPNAVCHSHILLIEGRINAAGDDTCSILFHRTGEGSIRNRSCPLNLTSRCKCSAVNRAALIDDCTGKDTAGNTTLVVLFHCDGSVKDSAFDLTVFPINAIVIIEFLRTSNITLKNAVENCTTHVVDDATYLHSIRKIGCCKVNFKRSLRIFFRCRLIFPTGIICFINIRRTFCIGARQNFIRVFSKRSRCDLRSLILLCSIFFGK